ncbi:hypothetical protein Tco_1549230 [Tanacetum coccineum]
MMSQNGFDYIEIALHPCRMHPPSSIIILSENIVWLLCCWNLMGESGLSKGYGFQSSDLHTTVLRWWWHCDSGANCGDKTRLLVQDEEDVRKAIGGGKVIWVSNIVEVNQK